jgi:hypothetical protein
MNFVIPEILGYDFPNLINVKYFFCLLNLFLLPFPYSIVKIEILLQDELRSCVFVFGSVCCLLG